MPLLLRRTVLDDLAGRIAALATTRPLRIAVDGRTASGKTTLANELAELIGSGGREIIRTSIDGFHRPKAERYARGRHSAEGYYYDARDLAAVMSCLLAPLGPGGNRHYRTATFDLENDRPLVQEPQLAPPRSVLIVDGTFLQRPELRDGWDLSIFVETSEKISEQRGVNRDASRLGGADAARELYARRYRPAYALYERLCAPLSAADAIFNNDDFEHPHLRLRIDGRLAHAG